MGRKPQTLHSKVSYFGRLGISKYIQVCGHNQEILFIASFFNDFSCISSQFQMNFLCILFVFVITTLLLLLSTALFLFVFNFNPFNY